MVVSKKHKIFEVKDETNDLDDMHDLQGPNCVGELKWKGYQ
jgi:hypothetical protein